MILAHTTFSALGLVMMIYGLKVAEQDALQILNHAAYKGALFLVVGIVERFTHTRDLTKLGGLKKELPITFWVCVLAGLSMAGLPPFFGFVAKESLYGALLENQVLGGTGAVKWLVIAACVTANAFLFAVSFKVIFGVFLGAKPQTAEEVHGQHADGGGDEDERAHHGEHPGLWVSPLVLAAVALTLGLLGATHVTQDLVNRLSSDPHAQAHVALIPTLSHPGPLLLSLATIGLGVLFYRRRAVINAAQDRVTAASPTMQNLWDQVMDAVTAFAVVFSSRWQSGKLQWYFSAILAFTVALSWWGLWRGGITLAQVQPGLTHAPLYALALCGLLVATTIQLVRSQTRLGAAIATTAIGFLVAMIYVVYSSPDIVLTQILIETVSTIFLLLVLFFMPAFKKESISPISKAWQMCLSGAVGVTVALFTLLATGPFKEWDNLSAHYLSRSFALADGRNAVNVIIVDFRGDGHDGRDHGAPHGGLVRVRPASDQADGVVTIASPILRTVARFAAPLTLVVSLVIFYQGHSAPGGGFIAGVLGAAAGAMYLMAFGVEKAASFKWVEDVRRGPAHLGGQGHGFAPDGRRVHESHRLQMFP